MLTWFLAKGHLKYLWFYLCVISYFTVFIIAKSIEKILSHNTRMPMLWKILRFVML